MGRRGDGRRACRSTRDRTPESRSVARRDSGDLLRVTGASPGIEGDTSMWWSTTEGYVGLQTLRESTSEYAQGWTLPAADAAPDGWWGAPAVASQRARGGHDEGAGRRHAGAGRPHQGPGRGQRRRGERQPHLVSHRRRPLRRGDGALLAGHADGRAEAGRCRPAGGCARRARDDRGVALGFDADVPGRGQSASSSSRT